MNTQRTPEHIRAQQALCDHVERPINREFNQELASLEHELRDAVSDEAWRTYLRLNRLQARMYERVIAAAFWQGINHRPLFLKATPKARAN